MQSLTIDLNEILDKYFAFFESNHMIKDLTPEELTYDADHMFAGLFYALTLGLDKRIMELTGFKKDRPDYSEYFMSLHKLMNP